MLNHETVSPNSIVLARRSLLNQLTEETGEKWHHTADIGINHTVSVDGKKLDAVFVEQTRLGLLVKAGILANGGVFPLEGHPDICASCWVKGPNFDEARRNGEIAGFEDKAKQLAYAAIPKQ